MTEGSAAIVRRLVEDVLNGGDTALLTDYVDANHVGHDSLGDHYGPEGARIVVAEYRTAFPDLAVRIEDLLVVGEAVAWRFTFRGTHAGPFMGIPPTGRAVVASGIAIDHVVDSRVVESWCSLDSLGLLRQLGATLALTRSAHKCPSPEPEAQAGGQYKTTRIRRQK